MKIKIELGLHQETVKRDIRKALNSFVESQDRAREEQDESSKLEETVTVD